MNIKYYELKVKKAENSLVAHLQLLDLSKGLAGVLKKKSVTAYILKTKDSSTMQKSVKPQQCTTLEPPLMCPMQKSAKPPQCTPAAAPPLVQNSAKVTTYRTLRPSSMSPLWRTLQNSPHTEPCDHPQCLLCAELCNPFYPLLMNISQ